MFENPWIRKGLELLAALAAMSFLSKYPFAGQLVTVAAVCVAGGIWMLRFHRPTMCRWYADPNLSPVVVALCRVANEPFPIAEGGTAPRPVSPQASGSVQSPRFRLLRDSEYHAALQRMRDEIRGHDAEMELMLRQIRSRVQMRQGPQTPVGVFLLVGRRGLGKRTMSGVLADAVYGPGCATVVDASGEEGLALMLAAATKNPEQVFVVENLDKASESMLQGLERIAAGVALQDPSNGAKVSFCNSILVLVLDRDAARLQSKQQAGAGTGQTFAVDLLAEATGLPKRILWLAQLQIPFVLPGVPDLAETVLLAMRRECQRYQLDLVHVSPEIVAREVEVIRETGSFETLEGRIARRMGPAIRDAHARGQRQVVLKVVD